MKGVGGYRNNHRLSKIRRQSKDKKIKTERQINEVRDMGRKCPRTDDARKYFPMPDVMGKKFSGKRPGRK